MLDSSFITHDHTPAVIHPAKAAFDCPALARAHTRFQWSATRRCAPLAAFEGRDGRLDAPAAQAWADGLASVCSGRHQYLWASAWAPASLRHAHRGQGRI